MYKEHAKIGFLDHGDLFTKSINPAETSCNNINLIKSLSNQNRFICTREYLLSIIVIQ